MSFMMDLGMSDRLQKQRVKYCIRLNVMSGSILNSLNLLKTKRNLLYIRNQSVPRCKHFLSRL